MKKKIIGIIALSRWIEAYDFNLVLSFLGAILAGGWAGWRLVLVVVANFLCVTFTFMINDVEDAEEDAHNEKKCKRNPICNGSLTKKEGHFIATTVYVLTLISYLILSLATQNLLVFVIGFLAVTTGFFYSWRKVRLKAMPVFDIISHIFMFSGGQFLVAYLSFKNELNLYGLLAFIFLLIFSSYGELDNEIRDFETDVKTHIKTTAVAIGRKLAIALQICFLAAGGVILVYFLSSAVNPWPVLLQALIITLLLLVFPLILYIQKKPFAVFKNEFQRMIVMSAYINLFLYLIHFRIFS
jgi:4-hydroxybenzoate polyprenyltransferase